MFYPVVEEYMMQNRQRELAKELELNRQLHNSPESNSDHGLQFLAEIGGQLRNRVRGIRADTNKPIYNEMSLDCVEC